MKKFIVSAEAIFISVSMPADAAPNGNNCIGLAARQAGGGTIVEALFLIREIFGLAFGQAIGSTHCDPPFD